MDEKDIFQVLGSLGASGVLGWYCWYVTSKTLPTLVGEFRQETSAIRAEAARERDHHTQQVERLSVAIEAMVDNCRAIKIDRDKSE